MRIGGWESAIRAVPGAGYLVEAITTILLSVTTAYHVEHEVDDRHKTIHATGSIFERGRTVTALGDPYDVPFVPAHFTGFGAQTWTVDAGDVVTWAYTLSGSTMTLWFDLRTTAVGGTPSAGLVLTIPDGWYAARVVRNPVYLIDNGVAATGYVLSALNSNRLTILRTDAANFTASAGTTNVAGLISFPVRTA
jgi:hypothetical protein